MYIRWVSVYCFPLSVRNQYVVLHLCSFFLSFLPFTGSWQEIQFSYSFRFILLLFLLLPPRHRNLIIPLTLHNVAVDYRLYCRLSSSNTFDQSSFAFFFLFFQMHFHHHLYPKSSPFTSFSPALRLHRLFVVLHLSSAYFVHIYVFGAFVLF